MAYRPPALRGISTRVAAAAGREGSQGARDERLRSQAAGHRRRRRPLADPQRRLRAPVRHVSAPARPDIRMPGDVDAAWLTAVLRAGGVDAVVADFTARNVGTG